MPEKVRVKVQRGGKEIEIEALTVDLEASLNLVDQLLVKLGTAPAEEQIETGPSGPPLPIASSEAELPPSVTAERLPEALMQLLGSDWGRTPRTLREVAEALELSAKHYALPTISTALARLTKGGQVRRLRKGDVYSYVSAKR